MREFLPCMDFAIMADCCRADGESDFVTFHCLLSMDFARLKEIYCFSGSTIGRKESGPINGAVIVFAEGVLEKIKQYGTFV